MRSTLHLLTLLAALAAMVGALPVTTASPASAQRGSSAVDSAGLERLVNGGFESGLNGWYLPSWFAGLAGVDGSRTRSGSTALRFQGRGSGVYLRQDAPASPGETVELSGWVNVPELNGGMELVVELVARHQFNYDLKSSKMAAISTAISGWVQIGGTATMPDRTAAIRLQVRVPYLDGTAYLDDLSLRVVDLAPTPTSAAPPSPPAPTLTPSPAPTSTAIPAAPTATLLPTPTPTPTLPTAPTRPPAGAGALARTAWPTYGGNMLRNSRSSYAGPQQQPVRRWAFSRTNDHWRTDYRGTGVGQNGTVYLAAGMAGVYAVDSRSGEMKWLFSPESTGWETWVEFPPTVAADGKLYVTSENGYIYALDPNGEVLWKYRSDHLHTPVSISPDGSVVHFTTEAGYIYSLDRMSGAVRWSYRLGLYRVYATGRRVPVVYDASGNLYFTWINTVWSLTPDGQKRWSMSVPSSNSRMVGPAVSDDGTLYFVLSDSVVSIGMDGRLKWLYRLDKTAFDRTPAVGPDGTIYIGNDNGFLYALNPNGTLRWRKQYVTVSGWAGGIKSNLLLDARGTLYFLGKDKYVYAVSSASQQVLWKHYTGFEDNSYPGIQLSLDADGTLYIPVDEGVALALGPAGPAG